MLNCYVYGCCTVVLLRLRLLHCCIIYVQAARCCCTAAGHEHPDQPLYCYIQTKSRTAVLLQDTNIQISVLRAIDTWLAEDHTRVEGHLTTKENIAQLVSLYARCCHMRDAQVGGWVGGWVGGRASG